jgi:hypothetical protein
MKPGSWACGGYAWSCSGVKETPNSIRPRQPVKLGAFKIVDWFAEDTVLRTSILSTDQPTGSISSSSDKSFCAS